MLKDIIRDAIVEAHLEIKKREKEREQEEKRAAIDRRKHLRKWYESLSEEEKLKIQNSDDIQNLQLRAQLGLPIQFRYEVRNLDSETIES